MSATKEVEDALGALCISEPTRMATFQENMLRFLSKIRRSDYQIEMHRRMLQTLVVKQDTKSSGTDTKSLSGILALTAARRMGKTIALATFAAAYLYTCPGSKILVCCSNSNQEKALLMMIGRFLPVQTHVESLSRTKKEHISYLINGSIRTVLPSHALLETVDFTKYIPDLILCDEASRLSTETSIFAEIVVPMLVCKNTSAILVSTLQNTENWYSKFVCSQITESCHISSAFPYGRETYLMDPERNYNISKHNKKLPFWMYDHAEIQAML